MEKSLSVVFIIIIILVLIFAAVSILPHIKSGVNEPTMKLNQACLELVKKGCDESQVIVDSQTFEEICRPASMSLADCKKYCGC